MRVEGTVWVERTAPARVSLDPAEFGGSSFDAIRAAVLEQLGPCSSYDAELVEALVQQVALAAQG